MCIRDSGGLVAVNDSNVAVALEFGNPAPAEISGNATDIFCDGRSLITGGASVSGASVVSCAHLLPGSSDPLP